jgi:hypothetical protein
MATIVYLDVEDEITSAATRIRTADGTRVGLVLPYGSRVATSRINFRLLAREAQANGRRLDIVAPDASARALAASAGLPVFGSVGEYESALDEGLDDDGTSGASAGGLQGASTALGTATAAGAAASAVAGARAGDRGAMEALDPGRQRELDEIVRRSRQPPVARPARRRPGAGAVIGVLILVIALVASGLAAALVLPAAEITVTPRIEPVGPISLTVTADPAATAVDAAAHVIPAQTLQIPVDVSGDFPVTGTREVKTKATGGVMWMNCDPTASYNLPAGTIVRTSAGIGFSTDEAVFLPVAPPTGIPGRYTCQTSEVAVTAVEAGEAGNVAALAIRVVPAGYNRTVITVSNVRPTSGGTRQEFPRVDKKDVDAALASLRKDLAARFATELANPDRVPPGATIFPATAVPGNPVPTVDPATLIGQEVTTFTLGLSATGTVLAVDPSPVKAIAEAQVARSIGPGNRLVAGSTRVDVGDPVVTEGLIDFPVTASAKQVRPLDASSLERQVLGLSEADARRVLEPYGKVAISLWPGWVSSVPTLEQRVTLSVADPVDVSPGASPSGSAAPSTGSPGRTPGGTPTVEPLPSG